MKLEPVPQDDSFDRFEWREVQNPFGSRSAMFIFVGPDDTLAGFLTVETFSPEDKYRKRALSKEDGAWAEGDRVVGDVYFARAYRGAHRPGSNETFPVSAGKLALEAAIFTHHAPNRNEVGDAWATAVGGELPKRRQDQVANTERNFEMVFQRLASQIRLNLPVIWP